MHRDYTTVDAVLISHLHADHVLDLVPYAYAPHLRAPPAARAVAEWPGTNDPARVAPLAPPGARRTFHRVAGAFGNDDLLDKAFRVTEYDPTRPLALGICASFHEVPHFTTTYAINFTSANGGSVHLRRRLPPSEELVEAARDTDLLIVEATPRPERAGERGHMTPAEAGEHAHRAGARRRGVTHISDELDREGGRTAAIRSEARSRSPERERV